MKRELSAEWARSVAPDLLTACEAEARDRARQIVVRRLTRQLVRAVEDHAGAVRQRGSEPPHASREGETVRAAPREAPSRLGAASDAATALCLHAITWARPLALDAVSGLDGQNLPRVISQGRLAAVVSEVTTDLFRGLETESPLEGSRLSVLAERHDAIVFAVARQGTALPARFGTVLTDAAAVKTLLGSRHDDLVFDLERLSRRWEWRCRLFCEDDALQAAVSENMRGEPRGDLGEGAAYLAQRAEARRIVEECRRVVADARSRLVEMVRPVVADLLPTASADERAVFSAALLVDESAQDRLRQVVEGLNAGMSKLGLRVEVTGPLPLYHFTAAGAGLRSA
jgi:hypothetical protein